MSESIVSINEESLRLDIKELVKNTVRDVINQLLEEEADGLVNAERYERTADREAYRSGHYKRKLVTSAGEVVLDVPKLRGATFQTAVIERYRRRETSVEEAIIEMYLAGVSTRRIEDVSQILWGAGVSAGTGDKSLGMLGALEEVFPQAKYQRCTVHFYRNVFGKVPRQKREKVAKMLKAIHAQESFEVSMAKAEVVASDLEAMKLGAAAKVVREGCAETLAYTAFPMSHWVRVRTNNAIERLNREIRRRTRVVGTFPDGKSALMLVTARLKYIAESEWGSRRYLDVSMLKEVEA